jgi:Skp family chaperone for outer membrane proteins
MLKYLTVTRNRMVNLKHGVETHVAAWVGQAETPATIQQSIDKIDQKQEEINALEAQLSKANSEARQLAKETKFDRRHYQKQSERISRNCA